MVVVLALSFAVSMQAQTQLTQPAQTRLILPIVTQTVELAALALPDAPEPQNSVAAATPGQRMQSNRSTAMRSAS